MDESLKIKMGAKDFIQRNRKVGFFIVAIFITLFIIYFSSIYFLNTKNEINNISEIPTETEGNTFTNLLPTFLESGSSTSSDFGDDLLGNFTRGGNNIDFSDENSDEENPVGDNTRITKLETKPVLNYISFEKSVSIKNYIPDKPKICSEKVEVVLKKDTASSAVKTLQAMLKSVDGYEDLEETGVLDNNTAEKLFQLQKKYAELLYKNKTNKTPTQLIDKETAHFLNLLCGLEKENADDFIQVPTIRYVTKEDRQIYDYSTEDKKKTQINSKKATGTAEVIFSSRGDFIVFRNDKNGFIDSEFFDSRTQNNVRLEKNITTLDFNSKNLLVYGVPGTDGLVIKTYEESKNQLNTIAQIPLIEWTIFWINDTEIGIYNKPTGSANGIYMSLNTNTKKLSQLAGPLPGLAVQPTDKSDFSIVSTGGLGQIKTYLLNNKTRTLGDLGLNTFSEKCSKAIFASAVFCAVPKSISANGHYPDDWYKGKTSFSDVIMYRSTNSTTTKIISYLEDRPLSVVNIQINKNGVFFMDENRLGLYILEP